jgi:hypothetical protein
MFLFPTDKLSTFCFKQSVTLNKLKGIHSPLFKMCSSRFEFWFYTRFTGECHHAKSRGCYLDLRRDGGDYTLWSVRIWTPHQTLSGGSDQEDWDERDVWQIQGWWEMYTEFCWGNLRERDTVEGLCIDRRIILTLIFQKSVGWVWIG